MMEPLIPEFVAGSVIFVPRITGTRFARLVGIDFVRDALAKHLKL